MAVRLDLQRQGAKTVILKARILLKADRAEGGPGWLDAETAEALDTNLTMVSRGLSRSAVGRPGAASSEGRWPAWGIHEEWRAGERYGFAKHGVVSAITHRRSAQLCF